MYSAETQQQSKIGATFLLLLICLTLAPTKVFASQSVTLAWQRSPDATVAGYNIYYGVASRTYTNLVSVGNVTNATISGLLEGVTYYFAATAYDNTGLESDYSNEASYAVPTNSNINQPPTLLPLSNLVLNENAGQQSILLSGISSGSTNEFQTLTVTATSSNPGLIPKPVVHYVSPSATGDLAFVPAVDAFGSSTITVTVNDGQASNNIIVRTFQVTVNPINQPPTLNPLPDLVLNENAGQQSILLSGISSGATNEFQTLTVTATSSNPGLIPKPVVHYFSPSATGNLAFVPATDAFGSATITVTVNDGQASNNTFSRSFTVSVSAAPAIVTAPSAQTAYVGQTAYLTVSVTGVQPMTYQWFFNGTTAVGGITTNTFLELDNVQFSQSGTYTVVVSNNAGSVTSAPVEFNVIPAVDERNVPGINLLADIGTSVHLDCADAAGATANWRPLAVVPLIGKSQYYFDLTSPLPLQRFYRVWQSGAAGAPPALTLDMVPAITLTGAISNLVHLDYIPTYGPTNAWVSLATVTLTNTSQLYFDVSSVGEPPRLYRIVPGP